MQRQPLTLVSKSTTQPPQVIGCESVLDHLGLVAESPDAANAALQASEYPNNARWLLATAEQDLRTVNKRLDPPTEEDQRKRVQPAMVSTGECVEMLALIDEALQITSQLSDLCAKAWEQPPAPAIVYTDLVCKALLMPDVPTSHPRRYSIKMTEEWPQQVFSLVARYLDRRHRGLLAQCSTWCSVAARSAVTTIWLNNGFFRDLFDRERSKLSKSERKMYHYAPTGRYKHLLLPNCRHVHLGIASTQKNSLWRMVKAFLDSRIDIPRCTLYSHSYSGNAMVSPYLCPLDWHALCATTLTELLSILANLSISSIKHLRLPRLMVRYMMAVDYTSAHRPVQWPKQWSHQCSSSTVMPQGNSITTAQFLCQHQPELQVTGMLSDSTYLYQLTKLTNLPVDIAILKICSNDVYAALPTSDTGDITLLHQLAVRHGLNCFSRIVHTPARF